MFISTNRWVNLYNKCLLHFGSETTNYMYYERVYAVQKYAYEFAGDSFEKKRKFAMIFFKYRPRGARDFMF